VSWPPLPEVYSLGALVVKTRFFALPLPKKPKKWGKRSFWVVPLYLLGFRRKTLAISECCVAFVASSMINFNNL
jgi:hypothetical protein